MPLPQLVISPPRAADDVERHPPDSYLFITAADWERYPGISRSPPTASTAPPASARARREKRPRPSMSVTTPPPPVLPVDLPSPIVFETPGREREAHEPQPHFRSSWSRHFSSSSRTPPRPSLSRTDSGPASATAYAAAASAAVTSAMDAVDTTLRYRRRPHAAPPAPAPIGLPLPSDESFDSSCSSDDADADADAEFDEKKAASVVPQRRHARRVSWWGLGRG